MEPPPQPTTPAIEPPAPGRFRPGQCAGWLPAMLLLGAAGAWAAAGIQRFFAPLVLFPLLLGAVLGLLIVVLMRAGQVGHRPTIVAGAALAALVTVAGQHYLSFWEARRRAEAAAENPAAAMLFPERKPPGSFGEFMRREAQSGRRFGGFQAVGATAWLTWALDAAFVLAPALALVVASARLPYCNDCRTWYRTVRGRRIDPATAAEIADAAGIPFNGDADWVRFRMIDCHGGCGPTGIALSWIDPLGADSSGYVWLDPRRRQRLLEILDRPQREEPPSPAEPGDDRSQTT